MKTTYKVSNSISNMLLLPPAIQNALHLKCGGEYAVEINGNSITFADINEQRRDAWVDKWYRRAMADENCAISQMRDITAVELYHEIGISKPCKGDKYDARTGIAVAYAKASGASIPRYI